MPSSLSITITSFCQNNFPIWATHFAHPLILIFLDPLQRAALHASFICNLAFTWWHFCFCRMLVSGVSFEIALPTKIHPLKHHNKKLLCIRCNAFCEDSTSFPGICYLADFIDTAYTTHNLVRRTKLIPFFFKKEIKYF